MQGGLHPGGQLAADPTLSVPLIQEHDGGMVLGVADGATYNGRGVLDDDDAVVRCLAAPRVLFAIPMVWLTERRQIFSRYSLAAPACPPRSWQ